MVAYLDSHIFDNGLNYAKTYADKVYLCSQQPTSYEEATDPSIGFALGVKNFGTGLVFPDPIVDTGFSRKIIAPPITDGTVLVAGTAAYYAVVYSLGGILLATNAMFEGITVTIGLPWSLSTFEIELTKPIE